MGSTQWEYLVLRLWSHLGGAADLMNDAPDASPLNGEVTLGPAGLLNARGAEGWELVSVVRQEDNESKEGWSVVAYLKRPRING